MIHIRELVKIILSRISDPLCYFKIADTVIKASLIISFADKLISSYSSYFPKKNDAFMLDLIDGHSYTVPGWIGRSTIIRTR